ncbi:MAG: GDSL-type esterase/lipase family protein [Verrucomicrobiota bacterium]
MTSIAFSAETPAEVFKSAKRVVFLGDSITWNGGCVADFLAWAESGPRKFDGMVAINLGLPSETVSGLSEPGHAGGKFPRPDLHERLGRVLEATKPDLIFACYGMNDGIMMPYDPERTKKFAEGMTKLKEAVEKTGAKIIVLTPPYYDWLKNPALKHYTEVLAKYSEWLMSQREKGWMVVDVNGAMTREIMEKRRTDPGFSVQPDAVHPDAAGHWMMAKPLIHACGGTDVRAGSVAEMLKSKQVPPQFHGLITQRMIVLRDAWLTKTKHTRPGIPTGKPLEQAETAARELQEKADALLK